jgi:hypothetical protein
MSDRNGAGKQAIGADFILPVLGVAFAIYFFISIDDLTWEAKANATLIGIGLLFFIGLYFARAALQLVRGEATLGFDRLMEPRWAWGPRVAIVALCAVFIFLLPWLGLTIGVFLLNGLLMVALRAGSWKAISLTSAIVAIICYLLFVAVLNSRMPRGPVEYLLAPIFGGV